MLQTVLLHDTNCNFCLFVAKKWKARRGLFIYLHNMITGKELATGCADKTTPPTVHSNVARIAGHKMGLPVRIVMKLCGTMESRAPIGYEDETGFHYGAEMASELFSM